MSGLLLFRMAGASFVGSPASPAILEEGFFISDRCWSNIQAAVSGDFLFNKRLRTCRTSQGLGINHTEMSWTLAVCDVAWDIRERFSIHLLAGPAASVKFEWQQSKAALHMSSSRGMFWGGCAKLILLEMQDTTLGVDFQGGGIDWMQGSVSMNGVSLSEKFYSRLYFWQLAAGLSSKVDIFRPYAGVAINQMDCIIRSALFKKLRFHDLVEVGMYEGCSIIVNPKSSLSVEARQFFEWGLVLSGEIRF